MSSISTDQFTYISDTKTFVSEISSLISDFKPEKLFPDSDVLGFTMVSHRTGKEVTFVHSTTHQKNGAFVSWEFKSQSQVPNEKDLTVIIYND